MTTAIIKTIQRDTKENIPPLKLRVQFVDRVSFTHSPLRSSSTNTQKPILKSFKLPSVPKEKLDNKFAPMTESMQDPLQCPTYFEGPVNILAESSGRLKRGEVSLHDLTEAYNVLDVRIREQAKTLKEEGEYPAIQILRQRDFNTRASFLLAIKRDIRLAFQPPLSSGQSASVNGIRRGMTEEEAKYARDSACLCQAALRFVADVFALPGLQSLFDPRENILPILLEAVLDVASAEALPSHNPVKTYALTIKVLGSQKLPEKVLHRFGKQFADVLGNAIGCKMGKKENYGPHLEGMQTIKSLLGAHPEIFLPHFKSLLPTLYPYLANESLNLRLLACKTLSAFARATSNTSRRIQLLKEYSQEAANIINRDIVKSKRAGTVSLKKLFRVSRDSATYRADAAFVMITISSLIILSGPLVFTRPESLKFLVRPFENAKRLRKTFDSKVLTSVWKCLIWSFSKLHAWDITETHPHLRHRAYEVVRQEGSKDLTIAFVGSLLWAQRMAEVPEDNIAFVLDILQRTMESSNNKAAGIELLHAVINGHDEASIWTDELLVPEELFCECVLDTNADRILDAVGQIPKVETSSVLPFTETDIDAHRDSLLRIWKGAVNVALRATSMELRSMLRDVSQTLLISQAQLAGNEGLSVLPIASLSRIISTYNFVLNLPKDESTVTEKQSLTFVQQMWEDVKDAFDKVMLQQIAPKILECLLDAQYKRSDTETRKLFFTTSSELLFVDIPSALAVWTDRTYRPEDEKLKRELWTIFKKSVSESGVSVPLDGLIAFLTFPMDWTSHDEKQLRDWRTLFKMATSHAGRKGGQILDITDPVSDKLCGTEFSYTRIGPIGFTMELMREVLKHEHEFNESRHWKTISAAVTCIQGIYPPDGPFCTGAKETLGSYHKLVQLCHGEDSIRTLLRALIPWIEDKESLVTDEDYNEHIIPIYCDLLKSAHLLPSNMLFRDTEFVDMLTSVFMKSPIPPPATGVIAFSNLCEDLLPVVQLSKEECPPRLALCVQALGDTYGTYVPDWMQSESHTGHSGANQSGKDPSAVPNAASVLRTPGNRPSVMVIPETPLEMQGIRTKLRAAVTPKLGASSPAPALLRMSNSPPTANRHKKRKVRSSKSPDFSSERSLGQRDHKQSPISSSSPQVSIARPDHPSPDDHSYSIWGTGITTQDVREMRGQDNSALADEPTCNRTSFPEIEESQMAGGDTTVPTGAEPRVGRSQTAPAALYAPSGVESALSPSLGTSSAEARANALRRTRTTPLQTLHRLHNAVSDDVLAMETQDLAQAAHVLHEMQGIIQAQISHKLEKKRSSSPPDLFD